MFQCAIEDVKADFEKAVVQDSGCWIIAAMAASGRVEALFKGRQFDQEIIVLCVRWYLRYKLSTRDLVEMMAERGVILVHTTILRWVQFYLRERRDVNAAKYFFRRALKSVGTP
jgi:transposase-like protein